MIEDQEDHDKCMIPNHNFKETLICFHHFSDPIRVRQQIYSMVDDHIQFANSILQNHKFSIGIGNRKIIRLIADRIKVD